MALLKNMYGRFREISGLRGELDGPLYVLRRETITATATTNLFSTYLTDTGLVGGTKLFSDRPMIIVQVFDATAGANAAITDFLSVAISAYAVATGKLDWYMEKIATTTPTIVADGDGAFEFHILAIGNGF
jgi:hypothetical protein